MDLAPHLERPFPWRSVAIGAAGLALVELVVLLGLAGVRLAPGHDAKATAAPAAHTTAAHAAPTSTAAASVLPRTPQATPHPLRPRARVSVLVLNGNGVTHAAANEAATLLGRGYRSTASADAPSHDYARSLVLYAPGYEREGKRLGRDAGIGAVTPLDGSLSAQFKASRLVVILGDS